MVTPIDTCILKTISSPDANGMANCFPIVPTPVLQQSCEIIDKASENHAPLEIHLKQSGYRDSFNQKTVVIEL